MGFFSKLFDPSAGEIKRLNKIVDKIDSFEEAHKALTDEQLRGKTVEFRERLKNGETLDDLLPEAYSVVREATYRVTGKRQFRVQMLGGIVLHQGRIAEMKTGEGKTLTATMPAYLNALSGEGVHVVTVNDYLAKFQGEDVGRIFRFLGMTVGVIVHDLTQEERKAAYACDITTARTTRWASTICATTWSSIRRTWCSAAITLPSWTKWTLSSSTRRARR